MIADHPPIFYNHSEREKYIHTKHTIKNPNFFVIDKISNDCITNHNRKYLFLIKCDFKLIFNNDFSLHIETDFHHNTSMINLKRYLLNRIEDFIEKVFIFSHIEEMNISTVDAKMFLTFDNYIKYPMQAIELKLNMILAKNPHLINSPNRYHIHPLIRKYSYFER